MCDSSNYLQPTQQCCCFRAVDPVTVSIRPWSMRSAPVTVLPEHASHSAFAICIRTHAVRSASALSFTYVAASRDLLRPLGRRRSSRSLRQATGTACPCTARIVASARSLPCTIFISLAALPLCSWWLRPPSWSSPTSLGAVHPAVASRGSATIPPRRSPSIPSTATQRQRRRSCATRATKLLRLCFDWRYSVAASRINWDGRTDRQTDRRISTFCEFI